MIEEAFYIDQYDLEREIFTKGISYEFAQPEAERICELLESQPKNGSRGVALYDASGISSDQQAQAIISGRDLRYEYFDGSNSDEAVVEDIDEDLNQRIANDPLEEVIGFLQYRAFIWDSCDFAMDMFNNADEWH